MIDYESRFNGYNVPENVKSRAINIMKRFDIGGLCDGMYIANAIAQENGSGDGCGHFENREITQFDKIADFLSRAYGCNIMPDDRADLIDILRDGEISAARMVQGLKKYIKYCQSEKIRWHGRDEWRVEYMNKCIRSARGIIHSLVNSMCSDCSALGASCSGTNCRTWTGCIYKVKEA